MTYFLNLEDVTELGILLMAQQGQDFMISDAGLLDSALQRPQASAFGEPAYPTLWGQAAALMQSLARNHTLVDGNKRMAWAATKLFLRFNSIVLQTPSPQDGEHFVLAVITQPLTLAEIGHQLEDWSTVI